MGARLLSLLLGLMLGPIGWAIVDPKGPAAARMPPLDLGMFEGHRVFIGWGLVALGIAAMLSAVLPKSKPRRKGPPVVDFGAADGSSVSDHHDAPAHHGDEHPPEDDHEHEPHGHAHGHHVSSSGSPRPSALW